jgi:hypothetical protein
MYPCSYTENEVNKNASGPENDSLCGLMVRVSGYRSRGPSFDSPALPDVLRSSGSGPGSTQPREYN